MGKIWIPLEDGNHPIDSRVVRLHVDGAMLQARDVADKYVFAFMPLPDNIRLCRLEDAPPCVEMTEARVETLRNVLNLCRIAMWNDAAVTIHAMLAEIGGQGDESADD